ncbi:MAG: response regulator [Bryobacteraceae bacterium]
MYNRPLEILLVEDNPGDVCLVREAFRHAGIPYRLSVATDGEEALAHLRMHNRDLSTDFILLDLDLPGMSGREVLREVKHDSTLARIPVIVLTTSMAPEDIDAAYDLHANCYLNKSKDLAHFFAMMKSIESFWFTVARLPTWSALEARH